MVSSHGVGSFKSVKSAPPYESDDKGNTAQQDQEDRRRVEPPSGEGFVA